MPPAAALSFHCGRRRRRSLCHPHPGHHLLHRHRSCWAAELLPRLRGRRIQLTGFVRMMHHQHHRRHATAAPPKGRLLKLKQLPHAHFTLFSLHVVIFFSCCHTLHPMNEQKKKNHQKTLTNNGFFLALRPLTHVDCSSDALAQSE